jgi:hypothetical protein
VTETGYGKPVPEKRPARRTPMPEGQLAGASIRLERESCYGFCPVYSVELTGDGRALYTGGGHVLVHGPVAYMVDPEVVQALLDQARAADFWSLDDVYKAKITDQANVRLSITVGGKTKSLLDYVGRAAGMPAAVSALEAAVDQAAGTDRWVAGNDATLTDLALAGWDFRSKASGQTLASAAAEAPEPFVLGLIALGAPLDEPSAPGDWPANGLTPLQNACAEHRKVVVQALVAAKAPVTTPADPDVGRCLAEMVSQ